MLIAAYGDAFRCVNLGKWQDLVGYRVCSSCPFMMPWMLRAFARARLLTLCCVMLCVADGGEHRACACAACGLVDLAV